MFLKMAKRALAAAVIALAPVAASAITIQGTIDIGGTIDLGASSFNNAGAVTFIGDGSVDAVTGDFSPPVTLGEAVTLTNIDFTAPGTIWEVAGFMFAASAFHSFVDFATVKSFTATGSITGNGFDATNGTMTLTAQNNGASVTFSSGTTTVPVPAAGLLLLTAAGGMVLVRRRKAA